MPCDSQQRIPVGISSCLLGQSVRYDGGHKRNACVVDVLGKCFEFVPCCPEVAIGMGVPRVPIRLTGDPSRPRAVGMETDGIDVTGTIVDYAHTAVASMPRISGYIFKSGSPSCGLEQVPVYGDQGDPVGTSSGLYAGVIIRSLPLMPVEEEGGLQDPRLRESFVERVIVYGRWQKLCDRGVIESRLIDFHTRQESLLQSLSETDYRRLDNLIASASSREIETLSHEYIETLMEALRRRESRP